MNGPMVNFLFYCHMFCLLSYICCFYYIILSESTERTGLHMRNLATILPLKLRLKVLKHFMRPKQEATLEE